jgi:hypothetical protein
MFEAWAVILYFLCALPAICYSYIVIEGLGNLLRKPTSFPLAFYQLLITPFIMACIPYLEKKARNSRYLAMRFTIRDARLSVNNDSADLVLYLRSFKDRYSVGGIFSQADSDEVILYPILEEFGSMVAIGYPGEQLRPFGAARRYLIKSENWQDVVTDYMSRAKLIVISPDSTQGVMWETTAAFKIANPEKIIISLLNFHGEYVDTPKSKRVYFDLKEQLKRENDIELPDDLGSMGLLYFDSQYACHSVDKKFSYGPYSQATMRVWRYLRKFLLDRQYVKVKSMSISLIAMELFSHVLSVIFGVSIGVYILYIIVLMFWSVIAVLRSIIEILLS